MSKRAKFLFISQKSSLRDAIVEQLRASRKIEMQSVDSLSEALKALSEGQMKCVIFNLPLFSLKSVKFVSKLRDIYREIPIVIISERIQREAFDSASKIKRVVILEPTYIPTELAPICEKISDGREIYQRKFTRFSTDQIVEIERMLTGDVIRGFVFNLSQGGAYLNLIRGAVVPGDILRMSIRLDKVGKTHTVFAKVIWYMQGGAGIRFVSAEQVYSSLLQGVK